MRLDKYLSSKFPVYSRAFLKSQIIAGNILVNEKITKPSYVLKEKDEVKINIIPSEKKTLLPNPDIKLNILYEDENIIAIDKPAGIAAHPARAECHNTIANALLAYYPKIKDIGDLPEFRPGIVHRLDRDTSGVMVVAKNQKAFEWLKKQFSERKILKKYTALVTGEIKNKKGIISKPIGKSKDFRKRTTAPLKEQKEAVTYYKIIKYFTENPSTSSGNKILLPEQGREAAASKAIQYYTLLEAEPKTGRTHQIRVHLASIGHPITGDHLYGFKGQKTPKGLERQFLHASYLKFSLLDGKILELRSELPEDLKGILQHLNQVKSL